MLTKSTTDLTWLDRNTPMPDLHLLCRRRPHLARASIHEAAHSVAARCFGRPIIGVTIDPDSPYPALYLLPGQRHPQILKENLVILSAGAIATVAFDPTVDPGDEDDAKRLLEEAWLLVGRMAERSKAQREIDLAKARAAHLVQTHWADVEAVAAGLLHHYELHNMIRVIKDLAELDEPHTKA